MGLDGEWTAFTIQVNIKKNLLSLSKITNFYADTIKMEVRNAGRMVQWKKMWKLAILGHFCLMYEEYYITDNLVLKIFPN